MFEYTELVIDDGLRLRLTATAAGIRAIEFNASGSTAQSGGNPLLAEAARQLCAYFDGTLREFDLPLDLTGSEFQQRVWQTVAGIPYGETRSYAQIAEAIGTPRAVRAVGAANGANPVPIIVPCHRVIGANGKLTGYGGGLPLKRRLLELESAVASGPQLF